MTIGGDSPRFTVEQMRAGIFLLHEVLPRARIMARESSDLKAVSALAQAARPYMREDNLAALLVYRTPLGGWIADVLLKDVPPGISNLMGTPTRYPLTTRDEAIEHGIALISFIIASKDVVDKPNPVFFYFDATFELFPNLLAILQARHARYPSLEDAHVRLKEITIELFGRRKPCYEGIVALSEDSQKRLSSVCHLASMTGVMRYPPIEFGMPGDTYENDRDTDQIAI